MVASGAPASPVTTTRRWSSSQTGGAATTARSIAISNAVETGRIDEHDPDVLAGEQIAGEHRKAAAVGFPGREIGGAGRGVAGRGPSALTFRQGATCRDGPGRSSPSCRRRGRRPGRLPARSRSRRVALGQLDRDRLAAAAVPTDQGVLSPSATRAMSPSGAGSADDAVRAGQRRRQATSAAQSGRERQRGGGSRLASARQVCHADARRSRHGDLPVVGGRAEIRRRRSTVDLDRPRARAGSGEHDRRAVPSPTATAPTPSAVPAGTRFAVQSVTGTSSASVTVNGSPAPTLIGAPGEPRAVRAAVTPGERAKRPATGSPPSAAKRRGRWFGRVTVPAARASSSASGVAEGPTGVATVGTAGSIAAAGLEPAPHAPAARRRARRWNNRPELSGGTSAVLLSRSDAWGGDRRRLGPATPVQADNVDPDGRRGVAVDALVGRCLEDGPVLGRRAGTLGQDIGAGRDRPASCRRSSTSSRPERGVWSVTVRSETRLPPRRR